MKFKKGKCALITGGSSGMGLEYARQLAAKGCDLVLVSNQQEQLDAAAAALSSEYGIKVHTIFQDLAAPEAAAELAAKLGGIVPDILICNAGMFFFKELSPDILPKADAMLHLHVKTNTDLCVLLGAKMKERGSGAIIIVSSMAARLPAPGITVYSATKAYLRSFGKSLAYEMRPYGVSVTTVCPAAIATPLYNLKPSLMKFGVGIGVIHTPRWLVKRALRASSLGRKTCAPSAMNVYLPPMIRLLPDHAEKAIWKRVK